MSTPARDNLYRAAATVRENGSDAWDSFVDTLHEYAQDVLTDCLTVPLHDLQETRGRAKALQGVVALLREAPQMSRKLTQQGSRK